MEVELADRNFPRHPNELDDNEKSFVSALEEELSEGISAIMSGYLRRVIRGPTGITDANRSEIRKVARKVKFTLPADF